MNKFEGVAPSVVQKYGDIAKERADWNVDAVATSTQNRAFLRGDDKEDTWATAAIFLNTEKAILVAIERVLKDLSAQEGEGK